MKKLLILFLLLRITVMLFSNDGGFISTGDTLHPTINSNISFAYERLIIREQFDGNSGGYIVDAYFIFMNPTNDNINLLVGFESQASALYSGSSESGITNFSVLMNGKLLPYKENRINDSTFAFVFNAEFKPGKNVIMHSYFMPSGHGWGWNTGFHYVLQTGSRWRESLIKDIEILVFVKGNIQVTGNYDFNIIGLGKKINSRNYFIKSGYLYFKETNFKPVDDLSVITVPIGTYTGFNKDGSINIDSLADQPNRFKQESIETFLQSTTKSNLRILRNTIYGLYGYIFKDTELLTLFRAKDWYIPDPNVSMETVAISNDQSKLLKRIQFYEK